MGILCGIFKKKCNPMNSYERKRLRYAIIEDFLRDRYPEGSTVSILGTKATVTGHSIWMPFEYNPGDLPCLVVVVKKTLDEKIIKLPELYVMDDVSKKKHKQIMEEIDEKYKEKLSEN